MHRLRAADLRLLKPERGFGFTHYPRCDEVLAAGKAPLHVGQPGYREDMDEDGNGIACKPIRR